MATGLATIQASWAAGNAASIPGCPQYDVIHMVAAQPNAATPPGTGPWWASRWPPVPGQPFAKCRPPMIRTSVPAPASAAWPAELASRAAADRGHGGPGYRDGGQYGQHHQDEQRTRHEVHRLRYPMVIRDRPLQADRQLSPHHRADQSGHGRAGRERGQAGPGRGRGVQRMAGQARAGQPGAQAGGRYIDRAPPGRSLLGLLGDQQLGELVAVAVAPAARIPQQQAPRPGRVRRRRRR